MAVLDSWSAPPALGVPPAKVTEPSMIMLWGINSECITRWLAEGTCAPTDELTGMAASPGLAEGPARVILSAVQINEVRDGEILVAPLLTPSWGPILCKIAAVVVDVGGIMSHAAIVCREYGVPAVTGTATGTKRISTGMRICVDGNKGVVAILD